MWVGREEQDRGNRSCILWPVLMLSSVPCCLLNTSRNSCISWQWANLKVSFVLKSLQRFSCYPKPIWTLLVWKPGYRSFQDLACSGLCSCFHFFSQTSLTTGAAIFMVFWYFISCQAWDQEVQRRLKIKNWVRKSWNQRPIFEQQWRSEFGSGVTVFIWTNSNTLGQSGEWMEVTSCKGLKVL